MPAGALVDLGGDDTSFVVDPTVGGGVLVHWGAPVGDGSALPATGAALTMPAVMGGLDVVAPWPSCRSTAPGSPGDRAQRAPGRRAWMGTTVHVVSTAPTTGHRDRVRRQAPPSVSSPANVATGGAISVAAELVNDGDDDYWSTT